MKQKTIQTFVCGKCGRTIRGNGYYLHAKRCKVTGPTVDLVSPIKIPQQLHQKFVELCKGRDEPQMDAVLRLISQEVKRGDSDEDS